MKCYVLYFILGIALAACEDTPEPTQSDIGDVTLEPGQKLVSSTLSTGFYLWVLTRPMYENEKAEEYTFSETSLNGKVQRRIRIHEKALITQ